MASGSISTRNEPGAVRCGVKAAIRLREDDLCQIIMMLGENENTFAVIVDGVDRVARERWGMYLMTSTNSIVPM